MITIELAPTAHISCINCKKKIFKNQYRLKEYVKNGIYIKFYYYCELCGVNKLNKEIISLKELRIEFFEKIKPKEI